MRLQPPRPVGRRPVLPAAVHDAPRLLAEPASRGGTSGRQHGVVAGCRMRGRCKAGVAAMPAGHVAERCRTRHLRPREPGWQFAATTLSLPLPRQTFFPVDVVAPFTVEATPWRQPGVAGRPGNPRVPVVFAAILGSGSNPSPGPGGELFFTERPREIVPPFPPYILWHRLGRFGFPPFLLSPPTSCAGVLPSPPPLVCPVARSLLFFLLAVEGTPAARRETIDYLFAGLFFSPPLRLLPPVPRGMLSSQSIVSSNLAPPDAKVAPSFLD